MAKTPAITVNGLTKTIAGQDIVRGVSFSVPQGSIYGILGPNGAGKTTTIRMITGLIRPSSGEIRVSGETITAKDSPTTSGIGALVEGPSLYEHLSARDNLRVFTTMLGLPQSRIAGVLEIVGLQDVGLKRVGNFSLGMKQRLGIAVALLHSPSVIILDEPTNGLDPEGIIEMRQFVGRLPKLYGATVLISSHQLHEIEQIADHLVVMNKGAVKFEGSLKELKRQYPKASNLEDIFLTITKR